MTILSVCQDAATKLNQSRPSSIFSTSDPLAAELALAANETAEALLSYYDWQKLITLGTLTGDDTTQDFALPDDYDRMVKKSNLHSLAWQTANFRPARDLDEWLYLTDTGINATPGEWVIFGGQAHVFPVMATGETARFYYISNLIVNGSSGRQTAFTADNNTFVLSEKLLRLGIVWRWRSNKKFEYAEDMSNYEIALSEEITKDKGSKILTVGPRRVPSGADLAWPGVITT